MVQTSAQGETERETGIAAKRGLARTFSNGIITNLAGEMYIYSGRVAQMAERSLSMREVRGSIPCFSTFEVLAQNWNWIFFIFWRGKDETIGDTVRITLLSWITDSSLCAHLSATHQLIIIHD